MWSSTFRLWQSGHFIWRPPFGYTDILAQILPVALACLQIV
jgi:hypothetical protein